MSDEEEIARLRLHLADAQARRAVLLDEVVHLAARIPEIRKEFGNPFYYSHPEEPDEGIANYNPNAHGIGLPTIWELKRVEREIERIGAELRRLEGDATTPH